MFSTKRIVAGLISAGVAITSIGSVCADATGLPQAPASNFRYDFFAEPVSRNEVKVTFQVTNNPGCSYVSIAFIYDGSESTRGRIEYSENLTGDNYVLVPLENHTNDLDIQILNISSPVMDSGDHNELFSCSIIFEVDDSQNWHEFSVAVCAYTSLTENINYDNLSVNVSPEYSINTCPYVVGDVNDDGRINITDSSCVLSICGNYGDGTSNKTVSLNTLNNLISSGAFANNSTLSGMLCAEAADADGNGRVQVADSNEILRYYSNHSAGLPISTIVGNAQVKTVVL